MANNSSKDNIEDRAITIFLDSLLKKASSFAKHMDNQTHILMALSSGIFIFSAAQVKDGSAFGSIPFLILSIFSLASAIVALFAVFPPWFMRKRGQKESLFYSKKIANFSFSDQYAQELLKLSHNLEQVIKQYGIELYNLSRYYYRPKRQLFKVSRHLLIIGILVSLAVMLVELIGIKTI